MNRRFFLRTLVATTMFANQSAKALLLSGHGDVIISIYPGTGAKEIDLQLFKIYTQPMATALASTMGKKVYAEPYRSFSLIESVISNNRTDILFVPPIVAIHAMQYGYQPLVRVRDLATGMLVRRKGQTVTSIGITEPDSWLGAMGQNVIAERKLATSAMLQTVKTQDAVAFLLEQKAVQAGVLRTEKANRMIATGEYEAWYPLPASPDFTVLIHDKLAASYAESVRKTLLSLPAAAVDSLQKAIHVPVNQFVSCGKQDYAVLAQAIGVKL
ncbi:PhnD/SsuA/transferrin family substrate-binding protein [Sulfuriferula sp. AH1]|uniref:PhnD/SsuA/transferrin family substrate-binding protein n=1 Tax=Sulfuriferula sp. AH1 TaxID=1985873 RepID=UPI0012F74A3E|nr:PhnD/SsuA/transferrin family substrate-binding protein [Sulfuriferula sp. AH1]